MAKKQTSIRISDEDAATLEAVGITPSTAIMRYAEGLREGAIERRVQEEVLAEIQRILPGVIIQAYRSLKARDV
jgi:hypothetical protein